MTYQGGKQAYTPGGELGKGGEGTVFTITGSAGLVLKLYNEALTAEKVRKLQLMAAQFDPALEKFAAWPVDTVTDGSGRTVGFVMKKLTGYVPLHMLFSPMDRKRIFPDKGYDFLIHVARNLATAFYTLHAQGIVVGDVNEGNILVNLQGMVAFIDCDSFQLKDGDRYHYCEVGVPRYTPPELLSLPSFDNVVRTGNTDSFSMAVLLFQLLFLGRHPFAGRNVSREDIDEETAIRRRLFAYSPRSTLLQPPVDSLPVSFFPAPLTELFQRAFEQDGARPGPSAWIASLDAFSRTFVPCAKSKAHKYPSAVPACPWCLYKEQRNIIYFIDDELLGQMASFKNIDAFVNGFKVASIQIPRLTVQPSEYYGIAAAPVTRFQRYYKWTHRALLVGPVLGGLYLSLNNGYFFFLGAIVAVVFHNALPFFTGISRENRARRDRLQAASKQLAAATAEYEAPSELRKYHEKGNEVTAMVHRYKHLPTELQQAKLAAEEQLYNQQLHFFLGQFNIRDFKIPNFGAARKQALSDGGIRTAADITQLQNTRLQGFGPAYIQHLMSWQRQMASSFVYQPDQAALRAAQQEIFSRIDQERGTLENRIRNESQHLNYLKGVILSRQQQLVKQIDVIRGEYYQAAADVEAFRRVMR